MKRIFEAKAKCRSCAGTGVYQGMAEREGFAVVCHTCKGSGCEEIRFEYEEFTGRKRRREILRVLQVNPGIVVGGEDLERFGGIPAKDFYADEKFPKRGAEMREFTCPAWWYQSADYKRKPDWNECSILGRFSDCPNFKDKSECWARFDREKR